MNNELHIRTVEERRNGLQLLNTRDWKYSYVHEPYRMEWGLQELFGLNQDFVNDLYAEYAQHPDGVTLAVIPQNGLLIGIDGGKVRAIALAQMCSEFAMLQITDIANPGYIITHSTDDLGDLEEKVYVWSQSIFMIEDNFNFDENFMSAEDYLSLILRGTILEDNPLMELQDNNWQKVEYIAPITSSRRSIE